MMQNGGLEQFGLTGSSIKLVNVTDENVTNANLLIQAAEESGMLRQKEAPPSREVEVEVSFTSIPITAKEVHAQDLEIHFSNLEGRASAKVNTDRLELPLEEEVVLKVHDFTGFITLDATDFSLEGKAQRFEANGLALSSRQNLDLSVTNVEYGKFLAESITVEGMRFPRGDGKLGVAEKLDYRLEQEELNFYFFEGKIFVDAEKDEPVALEGIARGIDVSGALLNLDVR
ncbi:hypothetical protein HYX13_03530 [Candidatus Woesearchaeota archaeon]|nr:hypothetical protein [Candidatus Woesearchaeota archaeon]